MTCKLVIKIKRRNRFFNICFELVSTCLKSLIYLFIPLLNAKFKLFFQRSRTIWNSIDIRVNMNNFIPNILSIGKKILKLATPCYVKLSQQTLLKDHTELIILKVPGMRISRGKQTFYFGIRNLKTSKWRNN